MIYYFQSFVQKSSIHFKNSVVSHFLFFFIVALASGIAAEILFFLEKIAAKSPALSFLRKGNALMTWPKSVILPDFNEF